MPIYAFQCAECGHSFDRLQKLADPDPDACPSCAAQGSIRRQLTAPSFRLAGSGWYETDFKKDGDRKRNLVDGGEGAARPDAKPEAKAEAKPAAEAPKADSKPAVAAAAAKPATPAGGS
ncbi:FmdB family zinc ribbon protein [Pseudoxanthomonas koreensis]|uniref:FmdB family zinc ribbon protein n=1 Tax=Pseudoxanthomonas koreensis TaxID=266061 RepID=UPI0013910A5B|nr:zinc ribbon domain-containing protein [Pseudoxanthomonas koreensis]KAF1696579.1 transcriptional regulator [Pseudoxanthomonas koreensis]